MAPSKQMALEFTTSYLKDALSLMHYYKGLADRAITQVTDEQLYTTLDPEGNSIAIIVKHLAGNMLSRWTEFLTTDGEKPFRDRDGEFVDPPASRTELLDLWERGWACVFAAVEPLTEDDMPRTITIRGEAHSVTQAVNRQLCHYAYHTGQIVFIAKYFQSANWKTLTIPKNRSRMFNERVRAGEASQR
jgi:hypothetical protein